MSDNAALESLNGLPTITSVYGSVLIFDNPVLSDLSALSGITEIGWLIQNGSGFTFAGTLTVQNNAQLTSLAGLENLQEAVSNIQISDNDNLTDISALNGVVTRRGEATNNTSLPQCHVDAWVASSEIATVVATTPNGSSDPNLCL